MKKLLPMILVIVLLTAGTIFLIMNKKDSVKEKLIEPGTEAVQTENIIIETPKPQDIINEIFLVKGQARVFENQFNLRIISADSGAVIYTKSLYANAEDLGLFGDFEYEVNLNGFGLKQELNLVLEVFDYSPKDGSEIDKVFIPLKFKKTEKMIVNAYFNNNNLAPEISCSKVFPVKREVFKTISIARTALEELLRGPIEKERAEGYFTSINSGVLLQKITIKDGTAFADFNDKLESNGSCKVLAIRAQITETLKQFPSVSNVVISINGRVEDILQP